MARPRTPIGTFGKISHRRLVKGRCEARARYRDWDGVLRAVQCTGPTAAAAELALKRKLSERSLFQPSFIELSADSRFSALIDYWLEDMEIEDRLSRTTRLLYERNMLTLVAPAFAELTLREIGVARCDYFIKQLARQSYSRARQARVVLRLALSLAVRHEIIPRNPIDHISRLRRPARTPDVFEDSEVSLIRDAIQAWEERPIKAGPRPDGQLGQIVEVLLGTSVRIGFHLAAGDYVIIQDADLEYDPRDYTRLLEPLVRGRAEAVYGTRFAVGGERRVLAVSLDGFRPAELGGELPVVEKTLVRDLLPDLKSATNGYVVDKVEGFTIDKAGEAFVVTDNDGVDDSSGETLFLRLGNIAAVN